MFDVQVGPLKCEVDEIAYIVNLKPFHDAAHIEDSLNFCETNREEGYVDFIDQWCFITKSLFILMIFLRIIKVQ